MNVGASVTLVVLSIGLVGCSTTSRVALGPTIAPATSREPLAAGVGVTATSGVGFTDGADLRTVGFESSLRANFTGRSQSVAFGSGAYFTKGLGSRSALLVDGGLHLAFERYDDRLLVGIGPYAALAVGIAISQDEHTETGFFSHDVHLRRTLLTFGPTVELDARFSRPSAIPFFGLQVGLMWSDENRGGERETVNEPDLPRPPTPLVGPPAPPPPATTSPPRPEPHPGPPPALPPRPGDIPI